MERYEYIIIGAGPAGLQMGYLLQQAQRRYIILERNERPGSFFETQPRHRRLLSLNKRFNIYHEASFNMRYDWNSLLTSDYSLLFRDYSQELYPHAADICRYMADFANKYDLNIKFGISIDRIESGTNETERFVLTDAAGAQYAGSCLLMATGAVAPYLPADIKGIELAEGYEVHNSDPKRFENKEVLIIGRGNSAFEVANHLAGHAGILYVAVGNRPVDLAWQTHFAGDVRAVNHPMLEMMHLKALHGAVGFNVKTIAKRPDGKFDVELTEELLAWKEPTLLKMKLRFDHVIRCTGWKYVDPDLFPSGCAPACDAKGKLPVLSPMWESSIPHLFYIGTTMKARDKHAASPFIHGFRYNVRTLFHLLENRYHGVPLPSRTFALKDDSDLEALVANLLERLSTTDALYQLFGYQSDVLVFSPGKVEVFYELPVDYVLESPEFTKGKEIIVSTLEYGFHNYPQHLSSLSFITQADEASNRKCATFLHPVFRRYVDGKLVEEDNLGDSLTLRFSSFRVRPSAEEAQRSKPFNDVDANVLRNIVNRVACVTPRVFSEEVVLPGHEFLPYPGDVSQLDLAGLPRCKLIHDAKDE